MEKLYFVYVLLCNDNSYYTGITNDLERRIFEHSKGINNQSYTYFRRPLKLVFSTSFNNPDQAISFEKKLKGWSRAKKEALIQANWDKLPELSECKNDTHYSNNAHFDSAQCDNDSISLNKCFDSAQCDNDSFT